MERKSESKAARDCIVYSLGQKQTNKQINKHEFYSKDKRKSLENLEEMNYMAKYRW